MSAVDTIASTARNRGKEAFKTKDYERALKFFHIAKKSGTGLDDLERAKILTNMALCSIKLKKYRDAEEHATLAMDLDASWDKAWRHRAVAREGLGDMRQSKDDLMHLLGTSNAKLKEWAISRLREAHNMQTLPESGKKVLQVGQGKAGNHGDGNFAEDANVRDYPDLGMEGETKERSVMETPLQAPRNAPAKIFSNKLSHAYTVVKVGFTPDKNGSPKPRSPHPAVSPHVLKNISKGRRESVLVHGPTRGNMPRPLSQKKQVRLLETCGVGENNFCLSKSWWTRWCKFVQWEGTGQGSEDAVSNNQLFTKVPGPIDNVCIAGEPVSDGEDAHCLTKGAVQGSDYISIKGETWKALTEWYGGGPKVVAISSTGSVQEKVGRAGTAAVPDGRVQSAATVTANVSNEKEKEKEKEKENENKKKVCGMCFAIGARYTCTKCRMTRYCSKACQIADFRRHKRVCALLKSGEAPRRAVVHGKVGIKNVGNTCFMNSIIQCLSHTRQLTRYFLSQTWKEDLNPDNPIGHGGKIAEGWSKIVSELWHDAKGAINPLHFKNACNRLSQGAFRGFQQQDAQEFLLFLLDGIHEDVNRVKKKPYIEEKDSDGSEADSIVADRRWEEHKMRNDSAIRDIFSGQDKSTLDCPVCRKRSIAFNPYNIITLALPGKQTRTLNVGLKRIDNDVITQFFVEVPSAPGCSISTLREAIADAVKRAGKPAVNPMHLLLADVFQGAIWQYFHGSISKIKDEDEVIAYEIPFEEIERDPSLRIGLVYSQQRRIPSLVLFSLSSTCSELCESLQAAVGATDVNAIFECDSKHGKRRKGHTDNISDVKGESTVMDSLQHCGKAFGYFFVDGVVETSTVEKDPVSLALSEASGKKANALSLEECLQHYSTEEVLDRDNLWFCPNCKDHVAAAKKIDIYRLPSILVILLKRFKFRNMIYSEKIDTFVDFPVNGLDMGPFVLGNEDGRSTIYDLYAVSNQYGRMGFGHYTAFARELDSDVNNWYNFDDSRVTPMKEDDVVTSAALA
eukprot:g197.t1